VGKTELVKALAVELFGSEEALIRLDMSEYMESILYPSLLAHLRVMWAMMKAASLLKK